MKNLTYIILWGIILLFPCCKNADSVYEEYLVPGGRLYPAKAIDAAAYPGDRRIEISWLNSADPKVVKARISWNNNTVWEELDINPDMDIIRREIKPLEETAYTFAIQTYDDKGNISVPVEVIGRVYGEKYKNSLVSRSLKSSAYNAEASAMEVVWYEAEAAEIGMELEYTDSNDQIRKIPVDRAETTATITDMKGGAMVYYSSQFKPDPLAIDLFQAPKLAIPYYANITAHVLKNTDAPFVKGACLYQVNGADRWFEAVDWTTNAEGGINGNVDNHSTLLDGVLGFWANLGFGLATTITNGKLYQTVELEAGSYRFNAFLFGNPNGASVQKAYVVAALGNDLPDANDVEQMALAFASVPAPPIASGQNRQLSFEFVLSEKADVSLGFVITCQNGTQLFFRKVELWKLVE